MKHSEQLNELAGALSEYQATAKNPGNTAKNPFLKNKYAPLNDILGMVRTELAKHGLSVSQLVGGEDKIGVTTMLLHKSGQYIADTVSLTPENSKGLSVAQNAGVVITYLRRYGLASILGIAGEDDTDGGAGADHDQLTKQPANQPSKQAEGKPVSNMEQWRHAISAQAKKVGCKTPADFYGAMFGRFNGRLKFDHEGALDWSSLDVKTYNEAMQLFSNEEWAKVLDDATLAMVSDVFEDDVPS